MKKKSLKLKNKSKKYTIRRKKSRRKYTRYKKNTRRKKINNIKKRTNKKNTIKGGSLIFDSRSSTNNVYFITLSDYNCSISKDETGEPTIPKSLANFLEGKDISGVFDSDKENIYLVSPFLKSQLTCIKLFNLTETNEIVILPYSGQPHTFSDKFHKESASLAYKYVWENLSYFTKKVTESEKEHLKRRIRNVLKIQHSNPPQLDLNILDNAKVGEGKGGADAYLNIVREEPSFSKFIKYLVNILDGNQNKNFIFVSNKEFMETKCSMRDLEEN